jgi:hypothetical protein
LTLRLHDERLEAQFQNKYVVSSDDVALHCVSRLLIGLLAGALPPHFACDRTANHCHVSGLSGRKSCWYGFCAFLVLILWRFGLLLVRLQPRSFYGVLFIPIYFYFLRLAWLAYVQVTCSSTLNFIFFFLLVFLLLSTGVY